MSSAAKRAANIANAQHSTGPRTEAGRAISSKNARKSGLFSASDFIRPGEEPLYAELDEALRQDLAPDGMLEHHLVDEIRRAMWRSRRCGEVEASLVEMCTEICAAASACGTGDRVTCHPAENSSAPIPDAMQYEATAKLQHSVDRARAQCHRLLHKCTAELRKLQTERLTRNETLDAGTDLSDFGLGDIRSVNKALGEQATTEIRHDKIAATLKSAILQRAVNEAMALPVGPFKIGEPQEKPATIRTQPSRNGRCACGSGLKYKRCHGRDAAPLPQAA